jgi:hypothetical protein
MSTLSRLPHPPESKSIKNGIVGQNGSSHQRIFPHFRLKAAEMVAVAQQKSFSFYSVSTYIQDRHFARLERDLPEEGASLEAAIPA